MSVVEIQTRSRKMRIPSEGTWRGTAKNGDRLLYRHAAAYADHDRPFELWARGVWLPSVAPGSAPWEPVEDDSVGLTGLALRDWCLAHPQVTVRVVEDEEFVFAVRGDFYREAGGGAWIEGFDFADGVRCLGRVG
jgi:hypothetical protein